VDKKKKNRNEKRKKKTVSFQHAQEIGNGTCVIFVLGQRA
jgi:hypothetical protein